MSTVDYRKFQALLVEAAVKKGLRRKVAEVLVECMVQTDMLGITTHGTVNLGKYLKKMNAGGLDASQEPTVLAEGPTWARLDGHNNFGMYNGCCAVDKAIEKAQQFGMGFVTVAHSGHCGACSNYSLYGAKKGYLCVAMSNATKLMCVPGAKGNVIGNSPISYAIPRENDHPIFMDIALSEVAKLKVVQYQKQGKPVPDGWVVDLNGVPTNTPEGNNFSLLPMSKHKGYCLAFFVEAMTTVLSGGSFDLKSWLFAPPEVPSELAHAVFVMDVRKMMDPAVLEERLQQYVSSITDAPKADGSDKIFYPGEPNWVQYDRAAAEGLTLPADTENEVKMLLADTGLSLDGCLI